jgi:hypothetical protein
MVKLFDVPRNAFNPPPVASASFVCSRCRSALRRSTAPLLPASLRRSVNTAKPAQRVGKLLSADAIAAGVDPAHRRCCRTLSTTAHSLRQLLARLEKLDLVAVRVSDEGDRRGATLHRTCLARDLSAGRADAAHEAAASGGDRDVSRLPSS